MNVGLTVFFFFMAWLFVGLLAALIFGAVARRRNW